MLKISVVLVISLCSCLPPSFYMQEYGEGDSTAEGGDAQKQETVQEDPIAPLNGCRHTLRSMRMDTWQLSRSVHKYFDDHCEGEDRCYVAHPDEIKEALSRGVCDFSQLSANQVKIITEEYHAMEQEYFDAIRRLLPKKTEQEVVQEVSEEEQLRLAQEEERRLAKEKEQRTAELARYKKIRESKTPFAPIKSLDDAMEVYGLLDGFSGQMALDNFQNLNETTGQLFGLTTYNITQAIGPGSAIIELVSREKVRAILVPLNPNFANYAFKEGQHYITVPNILVKSLGVVYVDSVLGGKMSLLKLGVVGIELTSKHGSRYTRAFAWSQRYKRGD